MLSQTRLHPEFHPGMLNAKCDASLNREVPHSSVVPETGLEPVRGCPQRFLRRSEGTDAEGLDVTKGILMLSVKKTLQLVADSE